MKARFFYIAELFIILLMSSCKADVLDLNNLVGPPPTLQIKSPLQVDSYNMLIHDEGTYFLWIDFYFDENKKLINYHYAYIGGSMDVDLDNRFKRSGNYHYPDSLMKYINKAEPYVPFMRMVLNPNFNNVKLHKVNRWRTTIAFINAERLPSTFISHRGTELYKYQDYWKWDKQGRLISTDSLKLLIKGRH